MGSISTANFLSVGDIVSMLPVSFAATPAPTLAPTLAPTPAPTLAPTLAPTPAPTTRAPTLAPTLAPTPAPTTLAPTLAPTPYPTSPPPVPTLAPTSAAPIIALQFPPPPRFQFPPNLVLLVHEGRWMNAGVLKIFTLRDGVPSIQDFTFKDMTQIFVIDSTGSVRVVGGNGAYLEHGGNCSAATGGSVARQWRFAARGSGAYALEADCSSIGLGTQRVGVLENSGSSVSLTKSTDDSGGWFIIPVAKI
jgi:hypothetical protein